MSALETSRYNVMLDTKPLGKAVFNTASGALLPLTPIAFQALSDERLDFLTERDRQVLASKGILVADRSIELAALERKFEGWSACPEDIRFVIHPTNACNLVCGYCYERRQPLEAGAMTSQTARDVADFIGSYMAPQECRRAVVKFYGGEALLVPEAFRSISEAVIRRLKQAGKKVCVWLQTNATLIQESTFAPPFPIGDLIVESTIDGPQANHDRTRSGRNGEPTYDRIIKAIHVLARLGVPTILRVNAANAEELRRALSDLEARGVRDIERLTFYECQTSETFLEHVEGFECGGQTKKVETIGLVEEMRAVIRQSSWRPKWHRFPILQRRFSKCPFSRPGAFILDHAGRIYSCTFQAGNPAYAVGQVKAGGVADFTRTYRTILERSPFKVEKCRACAKLPVCWGGCYAAAHKQTGSYDGVHCGNGAYMLPHLLSAELRDAANETVKV